MPGNDTSRQTEERESLARGQICLLEANHVVILDEASESTGNGQTPRERSRLCGVKRKTTDVVGEDGVPVPSGGRLPRGTAREGLSVEVG